MKIVLDLSALVENGQLTPAEAERLKGLARQGGHSIALNLLVGFGLVAVVASLGALLPSALTAVILGALLAALGLVLTAPQLQSWALLAQFCVVIGTLAFCGGVAVLDGGSLRAILFGVVVMGLAAIRVRSGLLIALAVLAVGTCLGSSTDYSHAMYTLTVEEPTLTILVFGGIALIAYLVSLRLPAVYERLALIAARVAVIAVNAGFWVGSLWGDDFVRLRGWLGSPREAVASHFHPVVAPGVFALLWAVALAVVIVWAWRANRLWVVNVAAVFAAIHFYTQWFERLGADPLTILGAGLLMLGLALVLRHINRAAATPAPA